MGLVRTTKLIDELLVRATEKALSERLLTDFKETRVVDFAMDVSIPMQQCRQIVYGLLCGYFIVDHKGNPVKERVTDSDDPKYWSAKITEAYEYWVSLREELDERDKLTISEIQERWGFPSRHAARGELLLISRELLFATIVVESLEMASGLLQRNWLPEDSCRRLQYDAIDWLADKLELGSDVTSKAKSGKLQLGLTLSEHYDPTLAGLYLDNTTRVRCELCYPGPLDAIINRRATIVHEAVHAVTAFQSEQDYVSADFAFWEGLAEFCRLHYFEDKLKETYEDWLFWPLDELYDQIADPDYRDARRRVESVFALMGDYRILSALLKMRGTVGGKTILMTNVMERTERLVEVVGPEIARWLIDRILEQVPAELLGPILYLAGGKPLEYLLNLYTKFDETFPGLVEQASADYS